MYDFLCCGMMGFRVGGWSWLGVWGGGGLKTGVMGADSEMVGRCALSRYDRSCVGDLW